MQLGIFFFFLLTAYGAAAEDTCPPTEVVKFAELYANPHLHPCQKVSAGFSIAPPMGYPTDPQAKAMCTSDACRALIKDVLALKPADCYLSFAGVKLNAYKLANSFENACKAGTDKDQESGEYRPTPKPTKYNERDDDRYYPTPKPTDGKYYPMPKRTEDDKHYPTPKSTDGKYYYTPKPKDDTMDHHTLEEPKIVKDDNGTPCSTHAAGKENAKDADKLKPPMNGTATELFPMPNTATELFPMPNTTYKANEPESSSKA